MISYSGFFKFMQSYIVYLGGSIGEADFDMEIAESAHLELLSTVIPRYNFCFFLFIYWMKMVERDEHEMYINVNKICKNVWMQWGDRKGVGGACLSSRIQGILCHSYCQWSFSAFWYFFSILLIPFSAHSYSLHHDKYNIWFFYYLYSIILHIFTIWILFVFIIIIIIIIIITSSYPLYLFYLTFNTIHHVGSCLICLIVNFININFL